MYDNLTNGRTGTFVRKLLRGLLVKRSLDVHVANQIQIFCWTKWAKG